MRTLQSALAVSLLAATGAAGAATTVEVTGAFTDYRFIGVGVPLTGVDGADPSTWDLGPITFSLSGTVTIDGGIVTSALLNAGTIEITYTSTGGVNPTLGQFDGFAYGYTGGNTLTQAAGNGASVTGTCTMLPGATEPNPGCLAALSAFQNETDSRLTNWNGIPDGYQVNDLFGGSGILNFALAAQDGITWTVGGIDVGDSITAQLFRNEPNVNAFFNAAFAGQLELTVVPVPAAVWLFASALGLLGWMRRRHAIS